jgi:hypothetical protein
MYRGDPLVRKRAALTKNGASTTIDELCSQRMFSNLDRSPLYSILWCPSSFSLTHAAAASYGR